MVISQSHYVRLSELTRLLLILLILIPFFIVQAPLTLLSPDPRWSSASSSPSASSPRAVCSSRWGEDGY